jgi:hypothetical protein
MYTESIYNFDKDKIIYFLKYLNEKMKKNNIQGELIIGGGAAMILVHNVREFSGDIDAIINPREPIKKLSKEISKEFDMDPDWLNDDFKGFIYDNFPTEDFISFSNLNIKVFAPECLIAMKINAARIDKYDMEDLIFLLKKFKIESFDYCMSLVHKYIPLEDLNEEAERFLEFALQEIQQSESEDKTKENI